MKKTGLLRNLAVAGAALVIGGAMWAGSATAGTLEDIKARGKLLVGIQAENPPWAFIDENGANVGYDADVAHRLAEALGVEVEFVRVTTPNRIAQLQTGNVDILIAQVGMFPDRAEVIQFSKPYSSLSTLIIASKDESIASFEDLAGKVVGTCRGCSQDTALTENAPSSTTIQRFDDDVAVGQALLTGQTPIIAGSTTILANLNRIQPDNNFEAKFTIAKLWMGAGMRKDDPEFLAYINDFVDGLRNDGTIQELNQKWLGQDSPEFPESIEGVPF